MRCLAYTARAIKKLSGMRAVGYVSTGFAGHFVRPNPPKAGFTKPENIIRILILLFEKQKKLEFL